MVAETRVAAQARYCPPAQTLATDGALIYTAVLQFKSASICVNLWLQISGSKRIEPHRLGHLCGFAGTIKPLHVLEMPVIGAVVTRDLRDGRGADEQARPPHPPGEGWGEGAPLHPLRLGLGRAA